MAELGGAGGELNSAALVRRRFGQRQRLHAEERLEVGLVPQYLSKRRVGFLACQEQVAVLSVAWFAFIDSRITRREVGHVRAEG
jgi:hypothetical protein